MAARVLRLPLLAALCVALPATRTAHAQPAAQRVNTTGGVLQGKLVRGCNVFRGIPFAEPPVGELRWRSPVPKRPWGGLRQAVIPGPQCPQFDFVRGLRIGKEDCLYLSVYSPPGCSPASPCPVMFWIFGGAWTIGSNGEFGLYTGENLAMKHGVVVVSVNYRVDVLGWLSLEELKEEGGAYGNYGLRDQTAGMRWTQDNILNFGGNPKQVTIFGESAGGLSVCQHITSPASNGLFSRAIMQSGDCDGPWLILDGDNAKNFGDTYTRMVGCPAGVSGGRANCLRAKTPAQVMEPYLSWWCPVPRPNDPWCNISTAASTTGGVGVPWPANRPPLAPVAGWTAVVDGSQEGLPDTPFRMMQKGLINKGPDGEKISVIMGTNQDEMALFIVAIRLLIPAIHLPVGKDAILKTAEHLVSYHDTWNDTTSQQIVAAYPEADYPTDAYKFVQCGTDFMFRCGTRLSARALTAAGVDVYLYNFNYHFLGWINPEGALCQGTSEILCGVYHASELRFVWHNYQVPLAGKDVEMADTMGTLWTNFAKYGSPNGRASANTTAAGAGLTNWPKYDEGSDLHLEINQPLQVKAGLAKKTCDFWDTLPRQGEYPH